MSTLLFVYGTLKRGCCNHEQMAGQQFVAAARTKPGFRLYDLGGFPAINAEPADSLGVVGEVWSVDAVGLERLDHFEGVHEGLYQRRRIELTGSFANQTIEAYFPSVPIGGQPAVGHEWTE